MSDVQRLRRLGLRSTPLVLAALLAACAPGDSRAAAPMARQQVAIVLDPTVFENGDVARAGQMVDSIAQSLRTPENVDISAWFIREKMVADPGPTLKESFYLDTSKFSGKKAHDEAVTSWLQAKLKPKYLDAWRAAHDNRNARTPATCIVTSLYEVTHYAAQLPSNDPVSVLLATDLLEVCSDWTRINFEEDVAAKSLRASSSPVTQSAVESVNLARLNRLVVFHAGSSYVTRADDVEMLHAIWRSAFTRLGLSRPPVILRAIADKIDFQG